MNLSEDTFLISLGIRIRQLREKKKLSQQELANDCDIPKVQIGRIERAEINTTIRTIVKIANALEVHPKDLLDIKITE
ncbi:helix-turn-helix transcriptional regulator [Flavobacterium sp. SUN046]|uniref:helix-turn-helix domain-containing protein n=1 Tax=Flavobacterium sp. SUN046 TaxID=3002440 RepID=UPI002DB6F79F|nr:helix-turn-helix transcriptional regulator [Flavobacterium sp. SUN046]MEC4050107.1 helix-turn-helix transcriptional regulator [Flavobacterium sp. SUN046]